MEPRPASPCTEHTLRQGLLISALHLTFWNLLTSAQLTIESVPCHAVEGKNLLLRVHNLPDKLQGYLWYKGEIAISNEIALFVISSNTSYPGSAHTGRETVHPNGSLLFENVRKSDTGIYTLQTLNTVLGNEAASVEIHVHQQTPQGGLPVWAVVIAVTGVLVLILQNALGCFLFLTKTSRYPGSPHVIHPSTPSLTSQDALHSSYSPCLISC